MTELKYLVAALTRMLIFQESLKESKEIIQRITTVLKEGRVMDQKLKDKLSTLAALIVFRNTSSLACGTSFQNLNLTEELTTTLLDLKILPFLLSKSLCEIHVRSRELSICLLDEKGRFSKTIFSTIIFNILVYADDLCYKMFEKPRKELIGSNFCSHLHTLSVLMIEKMYNKQLFDIWVPGGSRCFTYTLYSPAARDHYFNRLKKGKTGQYVLPRNLDIFYKYLKCLESKLILLDMTADGAWDDIGSLWCFPNLLNQIKQSFITKAKYIWLLVTQISTKVQPFDYGLIRVHDEKIKMEERSVGKLLSQQISE